MNHSRWMTIALPALCLVLGGRASAQGTFFVGDDDNFGNIDGPDDVLVIREPLLTYLMVSHPNHLHGNTPMPFDMDTGDEARRYNNNYPYPFDWIFGYTFHLDPRPVPIADAKLSIKLKGTSGLATTDSLNLIYTGDGTFFGSEFWIKMNKLEPFGLGSNGNGKWEKDETAVFTLYLSNLPRGGGGNLNLIPLLNKRGYLDVIIDDDTAVDWIELTVVECAVSNCSGSETLTVRGRIKNGQCLSKTIMKNGLPNSTYGIVSPTGVCYNVTSMPEARPS